MADSPSPRRGNRAADVVIAVVLLVQIGAASLYYVSDHPEDERFAWRMFSSRRLQHCVAAAVERHHGRPPGALRLESTVPPAWIDLLERGQGDVVEGFLRWRCRGDDLASVRLERRCSSGPGATGLPQAWELICSSGETRTWSPAP